MSTQAIKDYFRSSKDPMNSALLVLPLFVIYQVGILFTDGWRNGADFVTGRLIQLCGGDRIIYFLVNLAVLAVVAVLYVRRPNKERISKTATGMLLVESTIYAMIMGGLVGRLLFSMGVRPPLATGELATRGAFDNIIMSIGAGTYEELMFRAVLMGAMLFGLSKWKPEQRVANLIIAVLASSLIFSAFHYVPIGMDPWQAWSFLFRFLLGGVLAGLYLTRGFAVAVYTHAIYDIIVLVL